MEVGPVEHPYSWIKLGVTFHILVYRVQANMPLYDIPNEFQKGHSHIAAVVKAKAKIVNNLPIIVDKSNQLKITDVQCDLTTPLVSKKDDPSENMQDFGKTSKESNNTEDIQEGQVIGIITLEDVFEELLQVNLFLKFCIIAT